MRGVVAFALALLACNPKPQPPGEPNVEVAVTVEPTPAPSSSGEEQAVVAEIPAPKLTEDALTPDACPLDQAEKIDVNGDGTPELFVVKEAGRLRCRAMDLDMDGRPDVTAFFDAGGNQTLKLSDLDGDGHVDVRHRYRDGGCTAEHDHDGDGIIDATGPC